MNRLTLHLSSLLLSASILGGCASETRPVKVAEPEPEPVPTNMGGYINEVSQAMADQLIRNTDLTQFADNPVAVTSFVNLEDFDETSRIGDILSENMLHELQVRGHKVIDFKMMPYIRVTPEGDFVRSREVDELITKHKINVVLTGTYVHHKDGLVVNARMMEFKSGVVVSSAQGSLPGWYVDAVEEVKVAQPATAEDLPAQEPHEADVEVGDMAESGSTEPANPQGFSRELHALDDLLFSGEKEAAEAATAEAAERQAAKEARYLCSPQGICFDRLRGKETLAEESSQPQV